MTHGGLDHSSTPLSLLSGSTGSTSSGGLAERFKQNPLGVVGTALLSFIEGSQGKPISAVKNEADRSKAEFERRRLAVLEQGAVLAQDKFEDLKIRNEKADEQQARLDDRQALLDAEAKKLNDARLKLSKNIFAGTEAERRRNAARQKRLFGHQKEQDEEQAKQDAAKAELAQAKFAETQKENERIAEQRDITNKAVEGRAATAEGGLDVRRQAEDRLGREDKRSATEREAKGMITQINTVLKIAASNLTGAVIVENAKGLGKAFPAMAKVLEAIGNDKDLREQARAIAARQNAGKFSQEQMNAIVTGAVAEFPGQPEKIFAAVADRVDALVKATSQGGTEDITVSTASGEEIRVRKTTKGASTVPRKNSTLSEDAPPDHPAKVIADNSAGKKAADTTFSRIKANASMPAGEMAFVSSIVGIWGELEVLSDPDVQATAGIVEGQLNDWIGRHTIASDAANRHMAANDNIKAFSSKLLPEKMSDEDRDVWVGMFPAITNSEDLNAIKLPQAKRIMQRMLRDFIASKKFTKTRIPKELAEAAESMGVKVEGITAQAPDESFKATSRAWAQMATEAELIDAAETATNKVMQQAILDALDRLAGQK